MSITTTISALQARHAALNLRAPTNPPDVVEGALCPLVVVDAMNALTQWQAYEGDLAIERRLYKVRLLTELVGYNTGVYEARGRAGGQLDTLLASYRADPRISATVTILIEAADGLRDTGVLPHPGKDNAVRYGDRQFVGAELELMIEERYE